jgi:hypothetical protein
MRKLLRYTFAMFAAPWVTYRAVHDVLVPRLGGSIASFDAQIESNNAVVSGLAEENAFGRASSEEKRD